MRTRREYKSSMAAPKRTAPATGRVIGLVVAAVLLGAALLWILPLVLTRHPSEGMTAAERLKAINHVRAPIVGFLVAVGAAGTLWFTWRTYILNREGHVTDQVHEGRRAARRPKLARANWRCLRPGAHRPRLGTGPDHDHLRARRLRPGTLKRCEAAPDDPSEDVKGALRVLSRLLRMSDARLDLRGADLRNADLSSMPNDQVLLDGADLDGARLPRGF